MLTTDQAREQWRANGLARRAAKGSAAATPPRGRGALAFSRATERPVEAMVEVGAEQGSWPAEAEFILTALEAGRAQRPMTLPSAPAADRRERRRSSWRSAAHLRLFSDGEGAAPRALFTRDLAARSLGFITRERLPLGYGGVLRVRLPRGGEVSIDCMVHRCRETVLGWYEGAVSFNREQWGVMEDLAG